MVKISSNKVIQFLYSLLFFITPLVMFPRTSELFEFNKLLVIYLITGLILSFWIARSIFARRFVFRPNVLLIPFILFLLSQVVSTIFSIDVSTSIFGYYGRFNGGLLSVVTYCLLFFGYVSNASVSSREHISEAIEKLLKISLVASFVVMLWGLPSHFGYDLTCFVFTGSLDVSCWTEQFKPTIRIFSTLGQPNWLAAYLSIHLFIAFYFFMRQRDRSKQLMYAAYIPLTIVMLLFTRSRSALVATFIGSIVVVVYLALRRNLFTKSKLRRKASILIVLGIIPLCVVGTGIAQIDRFIHVPSWFALKTDTSVQKQDTTNVRKPKITDSSEIRKIVWQGAYSLGMEKPLWGTGVETFAYAYNFVRPLEHNRTSEWDYVYNKAHNELFNYFATTGFVGLVTYLIIFGCVILHLRKAFDGSLKKDDELLIVCLIAAYISIFTTNFFGFSTTTINLFYYLIPAWIVLVVYQKNLKDIPDDVSIGDDDGLKLVIPVCFAIFTLWFSIQYFRADKAYAYGDGLMSSHEYVAALPYLYTAFEIRDEHIYADKISQIHAQQTYVQAASGENAPQCSDVDGNLKNCIDLSKKYIKYAIKQSPYNAGYYRTKARNNFIFYQATQNEAHYKDAIQAVDKARQIAPTDPRLPYLRALFAMGYYETLSEPTKQDKDRLAMSGLSSIQFAIKLRDDYTGAYYLKGLIQKALDDTEGAKKTFTYILDTLDPENEQAIQELKSL